MNILIKFPEMNILTILKNDLTVRIIIAILSPTVAFGLNLTYKEIEEFDTPQGFSGNWSGIYVDKDATGEQVELKEKLHLRVRKGKVTGHSISNNGGEKSILDKILFWKNKNNKKESKWVNTGFLKNHFLTLSYQNKTGEGVGVYFLYDRYGNRNEYIGYWEGIDCVKQVILRCPYVMSSLDISETKKRWQEHLNQKCSAIDLDKFIDDKSSPENACQTISSFRLKEHFSS